jgi:hypothetical protein
MITIIEIPHQRPPRAWVAKDYKTACDVCSSIATDNEVDGNDRAALYEWLHDNQMTVVLETADDWRDFFTVAAPVHQRHKAHKEARELIRHMGRGCLSGKGRA